MTLAPQNVTVDGRRRRSAAKDDIFMVHTNTDQLMSIIYGNNTFNEIITTIKGFEERFNIIGRIPRTLDMLFFLAKVPPDLVR